MHLERVKYKANFNTVDLVYDSVDYSDDQFSHTYFEIGDLRIYIKDDELSDLENQCKELKIPVYIYT